MKKLQNDFTTPEQSKRLRALGVPQDSANYFYEVNSTRPILLPGDAILDTFFVNNSDYLPCWSVGRLQEIFAICYTGESFHMWCDSGFYLIDNIIEGMELRINEMDFSKLED